MLGTIAYFGGFNILKFIRYIKEELLIARHLLLGIPAAAHDEQARNLGRNESVVGLVIPTGYSFNLDGTCIYLTMAAIFLAQVTNTELTLWSIGSRRECVRFGNFGRGKGAGSGR